MRGAALKPLIVTAGALVSFAGNSILTRLALGQGSIDPASFSTIRLVSGAAMLLVLGAWRSGIASALAGTWTAALLLFVYAIPFSFSYVTLTAGTGALLLFGAVQCTMLTAALVSGQRPTAAEWLGLSLALGGLVYLVLPGLAAPSLIGSALMIVAGIAWGLYTLAGRGASDPLETTTGNFVRAAPLAVMVSVLMRSSAHADGRGALLAALSGAITSGLGYVMWYSAIRTMSATRAALVQLGVPVLAAVGGIVFMSEVLGRRLVIAGVLVLGGIAIAIARGQSGGARPGSSA